MFLCWTDVLLYDFTLTKLFCRKEEPDEPCVRNYQGVTPISLIPPPPPPPTRLVRLDPAEVYWRESEEGRAAAQHTGNDREERQEGGGGGGAHAEQSISPHVVFTLFWFGLLLL